jgi:hypothetical protein
MRDKEGKAAPIRNEARNGKRNRPAEYHSEANADED